MSYFSINSINFNFDTFEKLTNNPNMRKDIASAFIGKTNILGFGKSANTTIKNLKNEATIFMFWDRNEGFYNTLNQPIYINILLYLKNLIIL